MNPTYLGQVFKSALDRAKFLVLNMDKKIYGIATEVGYRKLDAFYKRFKEYMGKSAGELRSESELM